MIEPGQIGHVHMGRRIGKLQGPWYIYLYLYLHHYVIMRMATKPKHYLLHLMSLCQKLHDAKATLRHIRHVLSLTHRSLM